ncbi:MAG: hypothetical protein ACKO4L_08170, partial [Nodosilinea sp.]
MASLGCLAWLLWPALHVRADQPHHRNWENPLVSVPHQDSVSPLAPVASQVEAKLAAAAVKPSQARLAELSQLGASLAAVPDSGDAASKITPAIVTLESPPSQ